MHHEGKRERRSSFFQNVLPFTCKTNINCFIFKIASPRACFSLATYAHTNISKNTRVQTPAHTHKQTTKCFNLVTAPAILTVCTPAPRLTERFNIKHFQKNLTYQKIPNNKTTKALYVWKSNQFCFRARERRTLWKECLYDNVNQLFDRLTFLCLTNQKRKSLGCK